MLPYIAPHFVERICTLTALCSRGSIFSFRRQLVESNTLKQFCCMSSTRSNQCFPALSNRGMNTYNDSKHGMCHAGVLRAYKGSIWYCFPYIAVGRCTCFSIRFHSAPGMADLFTAMDCCMVIKISAANTRTHTLKITLYGLHYPYLIMRGQEYTLPAQSGVRFLSIRSSPLYRSIANATMQYFPASSPAPWGGTTLMRPSK